jgi:hypothetical protein
MKVYCDMRTEMQVSQVSGLEGAAPPRSPPTRANAHGCFTAPSATALSAAVQHQCCCTAPLLLYGPVLLHPVLLYTTQCCYTPPSAAAPSAAVRHPVLLHPVTRAPIQDAEANFNTQTIRAEIEARYADAGPKPQQSLLACILSIQEASMILSIRFMVMQARPTTTGCCRLRSPRATRRRWVAWNRRLICKTTVGESVGITYQTRSDISILGMAVIQPTLSGAPEGPQ